MMEPTGVLGTFCAALCGSGPGGGMAAPLTLCLEGLCIEGLGRGGGREVALLLPLSSCCPFIHLSFSKATGPVGGGGAGTD